MNFHSLNKFFKNLPISLKQNDKDMSFVTTQRLLFLEENKFLFLTKSGPIELILNPRRIFKKIFLILIIIVSFIFYNNLPESIHEKNRNFIITKINLINDLTKNNVYTFLSNLELILKEKKNLNIFFSFDSTPQDRVKTNKENVLTTNDFYEPKIDNYKISNKTIYASKIKTINKNNFVNSLERENLNIAENTNLNNNALPMKPEYVHFSGLENPPILTESIKLQRYYWSAIHEINNIKFIIDYLGLDVENLPSEWNKKGEFGKFDIPELVINLDKWREIIQLTPLKSPMRFAYVTSKYGWRKNEKTKKREFHHGTDFASTWRANIRPTAQGRVIFLQGKMVDLEM